MNSRPAEVGRGAIHINRRGKGETRRSDTKKPKKGEAQIQRGDNRGKGQNFVTSKKPQKGQPSVKTRK